MVLRLCVFVIALLASLTLARTDEVGCGDDEIVRVNDGDHDDEETYDVPQRIIGGFKVDRKEAKEQFEWMGSIQTWFGGHYCGGTLITPEWVLTAATCVKGPFKPSRIVFGQYDLFGPKESNRVIAYVSHAVVHSKFEEIRGTSVVKHDIALLKLKSPVTSIAPMKLIPKSFSSYIEVHGQMLSALGWGTVTEEGLISPALKIAHIPVVSNRQCTRRGWYHPSFVDEKMMCAGYNAGGNSTCYGDNGGPLIFSNYKRRVQVGIVSWSEGCGRRRRPAVFTRLSTYDKWITRHTTVETERPSHYPTGYPTQYPTEYPTSRPTSVSTNYPTKTPTHAPSAMSFDNWRAINQECKRNNRYYKCRRMRSQCKWVRRRCLNKAKRPPKP
mmetsp:Transcript_20443/g.33749  ORF Transcript_20443/g.33749 Transcript_20443/m.33749 type:complete len:384 (-) Transcript_20443:308-1459(-)